MARFYDIHAKAIERAVNVNPLRMGECFRVIMWEPLPPVLDRAPESDTATIITFRCLPNGQFEPASPADAAAIADFDKRHRDTPNNSWELPKF